MSETVKKVTRYILSGGTGAVVNFGVLVTLVEYLRIYPVTASIISFLCAFGVSFTLQKFWTFKNHDLSQATGQATRYFAIAIMNLGINTLLMYLFIEYTPLHYAVAWFITTGLIGVESYFLYKFLVFKTKPELPLAP